jgi:hypothetical protein
MDDKPLRRRRVSAFRLIAAFGAIGVGLLGLELVVRGLGLRPVRPGAVSSSIERRPGATKARGMSLEPHARYRDRYPDDPRGYFGDDHTIEHVANSQGWRDQEHTQEKADGTYRILGLGDSYLYGQGVRREDTCLARLPALISGHTEAALEVLNTGLPGANTAVELQVLEEWGLAQQPDLVLVHFVLNDVEPSAWRASGPKVECFHGIQAARQGEWSWLREHSALFDLFETRVLGELRGRRYNQWMIESYMADSANWAEVTGALAGIERLCREAQVPLVVVIFPFYVQLDGDYPFQPIHDLVTAHCEALGVAVLDLRSAYAAFEGPELWVHPVDQHPNEQGHEIAAIRIAEYLVAQRALIGLPN